MGASHLRPIPTYGAAGSPCAAVRCAAAMGACSAARRMADRERCACVLRGSPRVSSYAALRRCDRATRARTPARPLPQHWTRQRPLREGAPTETVPSVPVDEQHADAHERAGDPEEAAGLALCGGVRAAWCTFAHVACPVCGMSVTYLLVARCMYVAWCTLQALCCALPGTHGALREARCML